MTPTPESPADELERSSEGFWSQLRVVLFTAAAIIAIVLVNARSTADRGADNRSATGSPASAPAPAPGAPKP